ncbi:septum formation initiator family protein [Hahella aquimaris]|uniref:septum formation initiator family protein n=1 Tax=Hahella sp. HNIBRBA332 TaxID=3015983 RepID=UPI00273C3E3A|nr:septum formation initiator family protein [Hahella sp. HNIBRBA332]WLQ11457.1 septum formation initiator family protein [Hahella sp. HNIBRBA332]
MRVNWLWTVLALIIGVLQFRLWVGEGSFAQAWVLDRQVASQKEENEQLAERNRRLEAEVMELKLAQSAIEERARSQLGMVYPDEQFYLLIEN